MRFVVDESSVQFAGIAPGVGLERLEQLLDRLDDVLDQKYEISYSSDLFNNNVLGSNKLYDLYSTNAPLHIPRETQERLAVIFGRLNKWDDVESELPPELEVTIDNLPTAWAPSIAWVHNQALVNGDQRSACIVMQSGLTEGSHVVICSNKSIPISFISSSVGYVQFFRWIIANTTKNPSGIDDFAESAFPNIIILPGATGGIKDMSKPYVNLVSILVRHLSIFSDESYAAFGSGSWQNVPAYFGSRGVTISDENGNTKANKLALQQRTKVVDERAITFWWHSKLEPDRDRIHVWPDAVPTGGKLIVGIFCRHLT